MGSHAAIVARALAIPLVIQAGRITREAMNGDPILVDGDLGHVHLRPEENVAKAFREKVDMLHEAQAAYAALRDKPATTRDGVTLQLHMNAGLMADLPSLPKCGAVGVGLFRTELQFLVRSSVPKRSELAALYARILDAAHDKPVVFRTLDIGSDKVLPYMKRSDEPNPALGWRAIRVGLDRPGMMRMQVQALIRAAKGRPLTIMFPFVTECREFEAGRALVLSEVERERERGQPLPRVLKIGAMLETPSLAYASDRFFAAHRLHLGRRQRPQAVLLRRRPRERAGAAALRHAEPELPDLSRAYRDALRRDRHAALLLRRGRRPPGRGARPRRDRLPQPVDAAGLDRAGQGAAAPGRPRPRPRGDRGRPCRRRSQRPAGDRGGAERAGDRSLTRTGGGPAAVALALAEGAPHSRGTRTGGRMLNALTLLFLCQLVGEAAVSLLGITFPGPVLGMALLFAGLLVVGRSGEALDGVADTILRNLSLLFVPAAVGVMQQAGLIAANWVAIFAALALSTVATLVVTVYAFLAVSRLVARRRA